MQALRPTRRDGSNEHPRCELIRTAQMTRVLARLAAALLLSIAAAAPAAERDGIDWQGWSETIFERARRDNRFVLLDLEAVWCHWCHVMDRTTYRDPLVVALIAERFIAVKVDQDSNPALSRRYEEYGWPATVVFGPDGTEIAKRRGYLKPDIMLSYLQHVLADPSPVRYRDSEPVREFASSPLLEPSLRTELENRHRQSHDFKRGGFDQDHKFLDRDTVEYNLFRAREGDKRAAMMARQTLDGALALIDPAWGGMYQYSTDGDWRHPHFEKIMQVQADALRLYALAWAQFKHPPYRAAAERIRSYVARFLTSDDGAFYTSQDADLVKGQHSGGYFALGDAARVKRGLPAVDKNRYARENGWMIHALATLHAASGDATALAQAIRAARWVLAHRALAPTPDPPPSAGEAEDGGLRPKVGFAHGERDRGGPFLEDTVAMGRAFIALYQATGERDWLQHAEAAAGFIQAQFVNPDAAGYLSTPQAASAALPPRPQVDENIAVARLNILLAHLTGKPEYQKRADHAMRLLATEKVAMHRRTEPGILLAARELAEDPAHSTVVGAKNDPAALTLYQTVLAQPGVFRRVEWWDRAEGPLPNADVEYPKLERAAAFVCVDRVCSLPMHSPAEIARFERTLATVKR